MASGQAWDRSPFQTVHFLATPLGAGDFPVFRGLFTDPATMRFIGLPLDDRTAWSRFETALSAQRDEALRWRYWRLETADVPDAGLLSLHVDPAGCAAELGIMLDAPTRGRGSAREACQALLARTFDQGRLNTMRCRHRAEHAAMTRLARGLGFVSASESAPAGWMHWCLDAAMWRRIAVEAPSP